MKTHKLLSVLFVLSLILGALVTTVVAEQPEPEAQAVETVGVRLSPDAYAAAPELAPYWLADYGSFVWLEIPTDRLPALEASGLEYLVSEPTIGMYDYRFDPLWSLPDVPAELQAAGEANEPGLYLMQFFGPIADSWLENLRAVGLTPLQYYPQNAYLVWGTGAQVEQATRAESVRWSGLLQPAYKLNPTLDQFDGYIENVAITFYNDGNVEDTVAALAELGEVIQYWAAQPDEAFYTAVVFLDSAQLASVANLSTVWAIDYASPEPGLDDENANQIVAGNIVGGMPVTGYYGWLQAKGVNGYDVTWADVDTGFNANHPDVGARAIAFVTYPGAPPANTDPHGHGSHTAGAILGDGRAGVHQIDPTASMDPNGFFWGTGMAPSSTLVVQNALYGTNWPPIGGWNILSRDSVQNGAAGSSNSWYTGNYDNSYTAACREHDMMVRDADFGTTTVAEPIIYVFSAGNGGPGPGTLSEPHASKNPIVVGASSNYPRSLSSIDDMASFSSRGPTADGRFNPNVAAPGVQTASLNGSGATCGTPVAGPGGAYYNYCSGTSMACPQVAGASALIVDWWQQDYGMMPSPAMVKGLLINGADDMVGGSGVSGNIPNFDVGWGRPNLNNTIRPNTPAFYEDQTLVFDNTGETWGVDLNIADPSQPFKCTLAWTDAPGAVGANPALVNDLDLVVTVGGNTYLGNDFLNGWSTTGGTADALNNVENVFVPAGVSGSASVSVNAANIAGDGVPYSGDDTDQDFAIVCYNAIQGNVGTLTGQVTDSSNGAPLEGALVEAVGLIPPHGGARTTDASGTYTMTLPQDQYDVTASLYGYLPDTAVATVFSGTVTVLDFALDPAPMYLVEGYVTDAATGWPLYASIDVNGAGYSGATIWNDPVSGYYSITLVANMTYTFGVNAWVPGYLGHSRDVFVSADPQAEDFALDVDAVACIAPGYHTVYYGLFEDFEGGVPPAGWSVIDNAGNGVVWDTIAGAGESGNYTGGSGEAATANSDAAGGVDFDTELQTPVIDVASLPTTTLRYLANYQNLANYDYLDLDISVDSGAWQTVLSWNEDHGGFRATPGEAVVLDLSSYLAGATNFQLRWRYYDPTTNDWDWYAQIDNVEMGYAECLPPTNGGLVVGNVYDDNTMDPLVGAMVENEDGYMTMAEPTPHDPDVEDAFYTLFSPAGTKTFTATLTDYGPDVHDVTVVQSDTVGLEGFYLSAGWLTHSPSGLHATLDMGDSMSMPLTLENLGGLEAYFEIGEMDRGFMPLLLGRVLNAPQTNNEVAPSSWLFTPLAMGDAVFQVDAESPTGHIALLGVEWANGYWWVTSGGAGGSGDPNEFFQLDKDGNVVNQWPQGTSSTWGWRDLAFDGTYLYASDSAVVEQIDPATGAPTGVTIPCPTNPCRALAYDPATDHFWTADFSSDIWEFDRTGTIINTFANSLAIYGAAWDMYSDGGPYLWVWSQDGTPASQATQIDPATGTPTGVTFQGVDPPGGLAGGADIIAGDHPDHPGMLILAGMQQATPDTIVGYDLDAPVSLDVPWVSEVPTNGLIPPLNDLAVDVTFDAGVPEVTQPGDYYATLVVNNDTPYGSLDIPITMTVNPPATWGELEGTVYSLGYCNGEMNPVEGATVMITGSGGMSWTLTTDVSGTYSIWLDESHSPLDMAVMAPEHQSQYRSTTVSGGGTTTENFSLVWLRPCLAVTPDNLSVTVALGMTDTLPLTLDNTGPVSTSFEILEIDRGWTPALAVIELAVEPRERYESYNPDTFSTEGLMAPGGTPVNNPLAAGDVLATWPTGLALPWGTGFGMDVEGVWVSDPGAGGGDDLNHEYDTDGTPTGRTTTAMFGGSWGGDIAFNPNTGLFWQVNVDGDNCLYEWDADTGPTGNTICGPWAISQRGVAYDPTTDTYFVGGWNDDTVYHIDNTGTLISSWPFAGGISGLAYNWDAGLLFIMENSTSDTVTVVDPSTWSVVNTFTVAGFGNYSGSGLAIDREGNLWAANQSDGNAYLIDSGVPASLWSSDVPWLSEVPTSGVILEALEGTQLVDVTFDAGVPEVTQPGDYYAILSIANDDPVMDGYQVPVTMTVTPPATWGKLEGTVYSLGYCSDEMNPVEGATVLITGTGGMTWTLTTDEFGYYSQWLDESYSPLDMAVMAPEHQSQYRSTTVSGGDTTTEDFELVWLRPCLAVTPDNLAVTLDLGMTDTLQLTLDNTGPVSTSFEIGEIDRGWMPALAMESSPAMPVPEVIARLADGSVDCSAYENYIGSEPREVAESCSAYVPEPSQADNILAPTDIGFAQDIGYISDNFVSFTLNDFPGQTVIGTQSDSYYGMDFDPSATTLYALNDTSGELGTIDLTTGAFTGLVPCVAPVDIWTGLTIDPVSGVFYASDATDLYTIDPATGNYTLIGPFGTSLMIDIAMNTNGEMYGHDIGTDSIYSIDPTTGVATLIGPTGYNANYAQGMDFDNDDGTLYIFLYIGGGANVFGTVDLSTGAVSPLAVDDPTGEFEGAVQVPGAAPDVPWLSEVPTSGIILEALEGTQLVDVTFDAGAVSQPGEYYASLSIANDDPMMDGYQVPVTMTINVPATWGKVVGHVTDSCTGDPVEATIDIPAGVPITQTVSDPATGYYDAWLDSTAGPFDLIFTATGYLPYTTTVNIQAGQIVTQDAVLVPERPCLTADLPDMYEVWLVTGTMVYTDPVTMDLYNDGGQDLYFEITEQDMGAMTTTVLADEDVLVVSEDNAAATALETALTALGYTWVDVESSGFTGMTIDDLLAYKAVFYTGYLSSGSEQDQAAAYLDAGGRLLNVDDGFVNLYCTSSYTFCPNYLQLDPVSTNGGNGVLTGMDFMAGVNPDLSSATSVDDFTFSGPDAAGIFLAPSGNWSGSSIVRNDYRAVTLGWDFDDTDDPSEQVIVERVMDFLAPSGDVPWLWEVPISGTIAAMGGMEMVEVAFTTYYTDMVTPMPLGVYTAGLQLDHDDPTMGPYNVTAVMHIVEQLIAPTAAFSATSPVCLDETVIFTNTSTGTPTPDYLWDFGDGVTSTLEHPTHDYAAAGTYTVTLEACNMEGCDTHTDWVEALPLPEASFDYTVDPYLTAYFTNTSTGANSYMWHFGDGETSTETHPVHTYSTADTYLVTLFAYGDCGEDNTQMAVDVMQYYPLGMGMDGNGSGVITPTEGIHMVPAGSMVEIMAVADPDSIFEGWWGSYITTTSHMTMMVNSDMWMTATFTLEEYTLDVGIVGNGSVTREPDQATYNYGDVVTLTAIPTTDWYFDGWSGDLGGMTNPETLMIDSDKMVTATFASEPPTECIEVESVTLNLLNTNTIYTDTLVEFEGDVMPDDATKPYTYTVDYGDGNTDSGLSSDDPYEFSYTYANTGTYTVEFWAWNCDMTVPMTDSVTFTVYAVGECVDVADVDLSLLTTGDIYTDTLVEFEGDVMPNDATKPYTYTVDYGDGNTDSGLSSDDPYEFSYTYANSGTYTVEFWAWNCDMTVPMTDSVEITVMAGAAPTECVDVAAVDLSLLTMGTIHAGDLVNLRAEISPNNATKPYTYTIDYGDGSTPVEGTSSDDPYEFSYTYANTGTYTIEFWAWNCDMTAPMTDTVEITVEEAMYTIYMPIVMKN